MILASPVRSRSLVSCMPSRSDASRQHLQRLLSTAEGSEEIVQRLSPHTDPRPARFPAGTRADNASITRRWETLDAGDGTRQILRGCESVVSPETYERNIENFIGTVQVPVGIVGPLRVNGIFAHGDFHVPLATTEAALVASYHRGACLITAAGGAASALVNESLNRSPAFAFETLAEAGQFLQWTLAQLDRFREIVAESSRHTRLLEVGATGEGNHIYLNLEHPASCNPLPAVVFVAFIVV